MPWLAVLLLTATQNPAILSAHLIPPSPPTVQELQAVATKEAKEHHLNIDHFLKVINCESGWSATSTGALGELGIAQIYPKYHPELTREQMLDPIFSISWMASQWEKDNHLIWSCWSLLFGER